MSEDVYLHAVLIMLKVNFSAVISLIYAKCLLLLLYDTEPCRILAADKRSIECTVTRSIMNLFKTRNTFCGTWYLPDSRIHKFKAELYSNFGDSVITKDKIAYFSLRMRETTIFYYESKI